MHNKPTQNALQKTIAHIISVVLHPLWMPLYAALLVLCIPYVRAEMWPWQIAQLLGSIVLLTIVLPMVVVGVLLRRRHITQLSMPDRHERTVPYIVAITAYTLLCYLFKQWHMPSYITLTAVGMTLAVSALGLINLRWKISAHLCGIGAVCGATFAMLWMMYSGNIALLALFVLLSGAVAWARLVLEAHTPAQVFAGFAVGFSGGFLPVMLLYV